ncbi:MAG TPA: hypothetical protein VK988_02235 [Acidimicrobiales bacterium]|nr:hypothetical protein [Acidimicrobiales bacterium]
MAKKLSATALSQHWRGLESDWVMSWSSHVADLWRLDSVIRAILYLVDVEDLPYREVAGLGLSEEATRTRASRTERWRRRPPPGRLPPYREPKDLRGAAVVPTIVSDGRTIGTFTASPPFSTWPTEGEERHGNR